jgi:hypothetical protein
VRYTSRRARYGTRLECSGRDDRGLARLQKFSRKACHAGAGVYPASPGSRELEGLSTVKKLFLVALLGLSAFAVWRKVQADRAELNLWTEATTADE